MRNVTLLELKTAIQDRYDLPAYSSNGFVSSAGILRTINASLQAYYALLLECYGDDYFVQSTSITTSANISISSLPSRFHSLRSLLWSRGTDDIIHVPRATRDDVYLASYTPQSWNTIAPTYNIQGQVIQWLPTPNAAYSLTMFYSALPVDLALDADVFDAGPGHEEWVISEVCRRIAVREDKDPTIFLMERQTVEARIKAQASERDEAEPLVLRGVTRTSDQESAWARRDRLSRL